MLFIIHIIKSFIAFIILIKIIIRENQPFSWNWEKGIKGFIQKIIFIFGSTFFHFLISSILLETNFKVSTVIKSSESHSVYDFRGDSAKVTAVQR